MALKHNYTKHDHSDHHWYLITSVWCCCKFEHSVGCSSMIEQQKRPSFLQLDSDVAATISFASTWNPVEQSVGATEMSASIPTGTRGPSRERQPQSIRDSQPIIDLWVVKKMIGVSILFSPCLGLAPREHEQLRVDFPLKHRSKYVITTLAANLRIKTDLSSCLT